MEIVEQSSSSATAVPHLTMLAEFKAALADYKVNPQSQLILDETKFALLVGPTSSGRNTIINRLVTTGRYHFIVSDTTRPQRTNNGVLEQNGVEYWFRDEEEMLAEVRQGLLLEAEIIHGQQVSGISIRELEKAHNEHKIAITDVDIGGVDNILRVKPDVAAILILPPSFDEWRQRIEERGPMSEEEFRRRAETACRIFVAPTENPSLQIVINDNLESATAQVDSIAQTGRQDPELQRAGGALARKLYESTLAHL